MKRVYNTRTHLNGKYKDLPKTLQSRVDGPFNIEKDPKFARDWGSRPFPYWCWELDLSSVKYLTTKRALVKMLANYVRCIVTQRCETLKYRAELGIEYLRIDALRIDALRLEDDIVYFI